jgi:V/A-type H+-transporting ATPase subunit E
VDGLTRIQEKIIADANVEVQAFRDQANEYAEQQASFAAQRRATILDEAKQKAEADAQALIARSRSIAAANEKRAHLVRRQQEIDRVFDVALELLARRSRLEKIVLYCAILEKNGITHGEIMLAQKEQDLGKLLLAELGGSFTIAKEPAPISGGLLIKRGRIIDNFSYDLLLRDMRPELSQIAARALGFMSPDKE